MYRHKQFKGMLAQFKQVTNFTVYNTIAVLNKQLFYCNINFAGTLNLIGPYFLFSFTTDTNGFFLRVCIKMNNKADLH